ncbi:hypothetical protein KZ813_06955 [Sphingomonas sp. RHCKR7]|uniref:hypothetical protein n=1 Tax=Sphingomonas folli TaxID=2862497 RepID=UPI001CA47B5F|nr:hypothetical protein [Sphingomonas folli]MBW6526575.1 hypothetical protein [Sphingomonas folli]
MQDQQTEERTSEATGWKPTDRQWAIAATVMAIVFLTLLIASLGVQFWAHASTRAPAKVGDGAFDVFKIVLDKGVLALIVAFASFVLSRYIERDRNALSRQLEEYRIGLNRQLEEYRSELSAGAEKRREERQDLRNLVREERDARLDAQREERLAADRVRGKLEKAAEDELRRALVPWTQLDLECRFYGPQRGKIIVDLRLIAENRGATIRKLEDVRYRIYTMTGEQALQLYDCKDGISRLALNGPRINETSKWDFSVEPGIRQVFPLTTFMDEDVRFVLVKVDVYDKSGEHPGSDWQGEERFFPVVLTT